METDRVQELTRQLTTRLHPRERHWYADVHSTLRQKICVTLSRCLDNQGGLFPLVVGAPGSPIERLVQALTDYLDEYETLRSGTRVIKTVQVMDMGRVCKEAIVPGEEARVPELILQKALADSINLDAVLVLDFAEALDGHSLAAQGVLAALESVGEALVVAIYRQSVSDISDVRGMLSLAMRTDDVPKAQLIPVPEYDTNLTRGTIKDHFAPKWNWKDRAEFDCNAFEIAYALAPWIVQTENGRRFGLPYFAIYLGKSTIEAARFGGAKPFEGLRRDAETKVQELKSDARTRGLEGVFRQIFADIEGDLNYLRANPELVENNGCLRFKRSHIVAWLLGSGFFDLNYLRVSPGTHVLYAPGGPQGCADSIGTDTDLSESTGTVPDPMPRATGAGKKGGTEQFPQRERPGAAGS